MKQSQSVSASISVVSDILTLIQEGDAARSASGVRQLRLPACVGLSWACAKQGGRHTADRLLARNKQRVSLQVFDLLLTLVLGCAAYVACGLG